MVVNKTCIVSCPIDCYAGYGGRARDFVKALIEARPDWDVKILPQRWGNTRWGFLEEHNEQDLISRLIEKPNYQPDVWVQITIPNEFQPIGKFNIGVTAAMETDISPADWSLGVNRMDLTLVSSKHSKNSLYNAVWKDNQGREIKVEKPVEILFEGIDATSFKKREVGAQSGVNDVLKGVKENFAYLYLGHWLQGDFGEDRKNTGYVIKRFLETFKNYKTPPALILKTQAANSSVVDQNKVLEKINMIRKTVKGKLPNIYLLHGELPSEEIVDLYNHPKVKAMVSLSKGEGFNRPLLEFSLVGKPIIASGWSGHVDFLPSQLAVLVGGTLTNVHKSAQVKNMILAEAKWFTPNNEEVDTSLKAVFSNYKKYVGQARELKKQNSKKFSYKEMTNLLGEYLDKYTKNIPTQIQLNLPTLQKID